ncbi:MAG: carbamoyl-phosphate synthase large subunit [Verrucomicrobia bacterium]|nr:carbamoyl-phosphate synthase large subunit [Verrucomicrobiota bacterium]MDA1085784.1 carbamoyl-phosphate synthase large subunit [Verrucomicrobiota bacterium]
MPKRSDIHKIMLIGSGPIVIGQACEFDYSGVQACKALREEGFEVVLVNSNPATIMTDPEFADRTYIEPLTTEILTRIIKRERPDALLPTLGGQTALNLGIALSDSGVLAKYNVEMIGANAEVIRKAEDRDLFKKAMKKIGMDLPLSFSAHTIEQAREVRLKIGPFPLIIRPGFTLGGTGGGIAYDEKDFEEIVTRGLFYSPTNEVLIEESILGWKEFELEVMRDHADNCVVICSIENLDPMGVHTGDSITVAPAQTLTDREYQRMRDASIAVMREIGVDTGGSNVQWAINPDDGRMVIIEMNPRVSRSSALASKATGFPIAKIAAKLAVGYTLDEISNDITKETPASFEPTIDYVVTKIPRFAFEKFAAADDTLNTQMKSVGEAMAIGRTFKQSLQKALRSLEINHYGYGADGRDAAFKEMDDETLTAELVRPNAARIFLTREAFRRGWSVEDVHDLTNIDPWFLRHMEELTAYEDEIASAGSLDGLRRDVPLFRQAKEFGYSDRQIAYLLQTSEGEVRAARADAGITPIFGLVDTCAAEFKAFTPYFYSTYGESSEAVPSDRRKIMIIGGGPNRIGQGIEFDYCCVHASFALREANIETIMVNSNPETVSTDYDTSDRLYFEPLTLEDVLHIYRHEKCDGAIVQFGGQTPLNLAKDLELNGVNIVGTKPDSIEAAEDRKFFQEMAQRLNIRQPRNGIAVSAEEAVEIAERIGYPVLVRPSFVLGGRAMAIVYDHEMLTRYMTDAVEASEDRPVLIDQYLEGAVEVDVDCLSDGTDSVIGAIMEHVELAGIHSGDSACMIPPANLSAEAEATIRDYTFSMARDLNVCGLMNVQYAVKGNDVYVIEVNPRASRTVPFVSKAIGVPLAKLAALVMTGQKLSDLGFTSQIVPAHHSVKEAVFPFNRFPGIDIILTPEMKSTGEVMGIDAQPGIAFLKSQAAAGNMLPTSGNVFLSVRDSDKPGLETVVRSLQELRYGIQSTSGTHKYLKEHGIESTRVMKISEGHPNAIDLIESASLDWIVNTPSEGATQRQDEIKMRSHAVLRGIPITTTVHGLRAAVNGLVTLGSASQMDVCSLQEYHEAIGS